MILIQNPPTFDRDWYTGKVFRCQGCKALVMPELGEQCLSILDPISAYPHDTPIIEAVCPYCVQTVEMAQVSDKESHEAQEHYHQRACQRPTPLVPKVRKSRLDPGHS